MYGFGQVSFQPNYIPDNSPGINSYDECKEWYSKPFDKSKWPDTNQWGGWNSKRLQCEFGLEDKTITLSQSGPFFVLQITLIITKHVSIQTY